MYNKFSLCRFWDIRSGSCVHKIKLDSPATSVELSRDRAVLTVSHGKNVSFFDANR